MHQQKILDFEQFEPKKRCFCSKSRDFARNTAFSGQKKVHFTGYTHQKIARNQHILPKNGQNMRIFARFGLKTADFEVFLLGLHRQKIVDFHTNSTQIHDFQGKMVFFARFEGKLRNLHTIYTQIAVFSIIFSI